MNNNRIAQDVAAVTLPAPKEPILAQPQQIELEKAALRLLASDPVQSAIASVKELYANDPIGKTHSGRATLGRYAENLAYQAALYAADFDTVNPFILWSTNAGHSWHGINVPTSGYGLDSPDNIYRHATFDGAARYEIRGSIEGEGPAQQTFVIYTSIPGVTQTMNADGHMMEVAGIKSETLVREADGSFVVTMDADPANGRTNHMQVPADNNSLHLMIRDSLADWTKQRPVRLSIERIDAAPDQAGRSETEKAAHAAQILQSYAPYWANWVRSYLGGKPINEVVEPWMRQTGWGMTQQGRFCLGADEAWVITLNPLDAQYFNIQISDPWAKAVQYVNRTGSFNQNQADVCKDGTITLVASPQDPGVFNWLDTAGLSEGTFQARWQSLPDSVTSGKDAVVSVKVVKMGELGAHLPEGTRRVSAQERALQQELRAASYANRLC